ncbi:MAG: dinitrogenase iron-molybdenum cofactor biosynthesis protein [Spirochaetaceae bacterium]|jgi:predicted Fe-Mo cluster-binding NifX family protein|nr:dinitrogenase iron-molybdenum cofactor biosynthesis protein [Spirochaetaceae bacterium]
MAWRIAITSADDVLINQHFGHARWFVIRDLERDGTIVHRGRRDISQVCGNGDHGAGVWDEVLEVLRDCSAVITARIGPGPRKRLELAGIAVFEELASIDDALKMLAAYYAKTNKEEPSLDAPA